MAGKSQNNFAGVGLALLGVFFSVAILGDPPGTEVYGDADGNGFVNESDVKAIMGLVESLKVGKSAKPELPNHVQFKHCDINQDGKLTEDDGRALQKHLANESLELTATLPMSQSLELATGNAVYIRVNESFFPYHLKEVKGHIWSNAAGYDLEIPVFSHEEFGGAFYYMWDTAGLEPASDYAISVSAEKTFGKLEERQLEVRLAPPAVEPVVLLQEEDLILPYHDIGLGAIRVYSHHSSMSSRPGASGYGFGWNHIFGLRLEPQTDRSIAVFSPSDPRPAYFFPKRDHSHKVIEGAFVAPFRDNSRLWRDKDGTVVLSDARGKSWSFRPFLRPVGYLKTPDATLQTDWVESIPYSLTERSPKKKQNMADPTLLVEVKGPEGASWVFSPPSPDSKDSKQNRAFFKSAPDCKHTLRLDESGQFRLTLADGVAWVFRRTLQLASVKNGGLNTLTFDYDTRGRMVSMHDTTDQRVTLEYEDKVNPECITAVRDSTGRSVRYIYDDTGLREVIDLSGQSTFFEYDKKNRLTLVRNSDETAQEFVYDNENRLSATSTLPARRRISIAYQYPDFRDRTRIMTQSISESESRTREDVFDINGCLVRSSGFQGMRGTHRYDANGSLSAVDMPGGHNWSLRHTPGGWNSTDPPERWEITDPIGATTIYTISPYARSIASASRKDSSMSTAFEYMENGQHSISRFLDGSMEKNLWKREGENLTIDRVLRNNQVNHYVTDARGLLVARAFAKEPHANYAYDPQGNMISASNRTGTITFEYDALSRLRFATYPGGRKFSYEYDRSNRRIAMTDPDGRTIHYEYNDAESTAQLTSSVDGTIANYRFNFTGEVTHRGLRNDLSTEYAYDGDGRLLRLATSGLIDPASMVWTCTYNDAGDVARIQSEGSVSSYEYDGLSRLMHAAHSNGLDEAFEYDAFGTRSASAINGRKTPIISNLLGQFISQDGRMLKYDQRGNLTSVESAGENRKRTAYEYDSEGRLWRVRRVDGGLIVYTYDALGRLATRTANGSTLRFLWDLDQITIIEDDAHQTRQRLIWGLRKGELLQKQMMDHEMLCVQDGTGRIVSWRNLNGSTVEQYQYSAFGVPIDAPTGEFAFMLHSNLYDAETGLYLIRGRWYSPEMGRFIHIVVCEPPSVWNPYKYLNDNPISSRKNQRVDRGRFPSMTDPVLDELAVGAPIPPRTELPLTELMNSESPSAQTWDETLRESLRIGVRGRNSQ